MSPTLRKRGSVSASATVGLVANITDPGEWSGWGASTTLPVGAAFAARLLPPSVGGKGLNGFLQKLAYMNNRNRLDGIVQVGFSTSGPAYVKGGLWSNSFSMEFGWLSDPMSAREIFGANYEAIRSVVGASMLSTLQENPTTMFSYAAQLQNML